MFRYEIKQQFASIVFIGKFNPPIFSPAWLGKIGLISDAEIELARNTIIHQEIAQFSIESFDITVVPNRFFMRISQEPFIQIVDNIGDIFGKALPHTPLNRMGINYEVIFNLENYEQRHKLGRKLAPIEPWGDFGKRLETGKAETNGGLFHLSMQEKRPNEELYQGWRLVEIEPINSPGDSCVSIKINDHFQNIKENDVAGALPMIGLLNSKFDSSIQAAKKIVAEFMQFAGNLK